MRRTTKLLGVLALVAVTLMSTWGVGVSGAQEHDDHHGGHGGHDHSSTTTTQPGGSTTTTRPATTTTRPPTTPGARTTDIRYGPFTIPAATDNPDGTHGHSHTGNQFSFFIQKPCSNCYVTGMQADLVYADGRRAGYSTDAQLHHMVLGNWSFARSDATCAFPLGLLIGQRFFASGDERTPVIAPPGYGYHVGAFDTWNMIWELAGTSREQQSVFIRMTYNWVPDTTPGMTNVEPIWFDVDQCGDSEVSVPAGRSSKSWTWTVNRPGPIVGIGGHVHDGGINLTATNDSTGQLICDSRAGYGESPLYVDHHGEGHLSSMSTCLGTRERPVARVSNGQRVTIRANYDMPAAVDDQMGIAIAYVGTS